MEIISLYETVADITGQMVAAARSGDWDALAALESRCSVHVESIREHEQVRKPLPPQARERKISIIRKILADDREIRDITEPWVARLSAIMSSASAERKLAQAYGESANS